jgi:hypothetical protein
LTARGKFCPSDGLGYPSSFRAIVPGSILPLFDGNSLGGVVDEYADWFVDKLIRHSCGHISFLLVAEANTIS